MPACKDADTLSKSNSSIDAATKRSCRIQKFIISRNRTRNPGYGWLFSDESVMRYLHNWTFMRLLITPPHCIMDYRHTQSTLDSSLNQQCRMGSRLMVATTTRKIFNIVGLFLYFTIYSKSDFFWKTLYYRVIQ